MRFFSVHTHNLGVVLAVELCHQVDGGGMQAESHCTLPLKEVGFWKLLTVSESWSLESVCESKGSDVTHCLQVLSLRLPSARKATRMKLNSRITLLLTSSSSSSERLSVFAAAPLKLAFPIPLNSYLRLIHIQAYSRRYLSQIQNIFRGCSHYLCFYQQLPYIISSYISFSQSWTMQL